MIWASGGRFVRVQSLLDQRRVTPSWEVTRISRSERLTSRVHGTWPALVSTSFSSGRWPTLYCGAPSSTVTCVDASGHGWFGSGGGGGGGGLVVGFGLLGAEDEDEGPALFDAGGGGLEGGCESRTLPLAPCTGGEFWPKKPPAAQPTITSAITTPPTATMR